MLNKTKLEAKAKWGNKYGNWNHDVSANAENVKHFCRLILVSNSCEQSRFHSTEIWQCSLMVRTRPSHNVTRLKVNSLYCNCCLGYRNRLLNMWVNKQQELTQTNNRTSLNVSVFFALQDRDGWWEHHALCVHGSHSLNAFESFADVLCVHKCVAHILFGQNEMLQDFRTLLPLGPVLHKWPFESQPRVEAEKEHPQREFTAWKHNPNLTHARFINMSSFPNTTNRQRMKSDFVCMETLSLPASRKMFVTGRS